MCSSDLLKGATEAVEFPADPDGALTSFWVKGDQFVLCDERGGTTTVHHPLPLTPADAVETYRISDDFRQQGIPAFFRLAGGIVPDGAGDFTVTYTWPDGQTSTSQTVTDGQGRTWWRVVFPYKGGGNELEQPHIQVTASYDGASHHYELQPAIDTCAQANHGC